MKKKDLILDTLYEVRYLRKHATKEEIRKLDFTKFNPSDEEECIYGQMTGSCYSERAAELYPKKYNDTYCSYFNGSDEKKFIRNMEINNDQYFTALEVFVTLGYKDQNKKIMDYLKGETDDLTLEIK